MSKTEYAMHPELVPDIKWKEWTYLNLPNDNLWVSDIDSLIRSKDGCFILVELKRGKKEMKRWQKLTYGILATLLKESEGRTLTSEYLEFPIKVKHFCGLAEIRFEKSWFDDGDVYLNGTLSSESEILYFLQFGAFCLDCFSEHNQDCCIPPSES